MALDQRLAIAVRGAFALALVSALAAGSPALAQAGAVVQPLPPAALAELNAALADLSHDPRNVSALLRAGWASLDLGDTQAALGFFRRVDQSAPTNGEAKAGMASAMLQLDQPANAVKLFGEAEAARIPMARYAGDRGLALDLVGENVAAQGYYRQALAQKYDPDIVRRLALSQAIAGDQRASEATLLPLLQQRDLESYRTRAFALAILGKGEEAVSIAQTMLPATLSNRMAPYLRYMPRLTRAQQAAAADLGKFPPAAEIGHDDPQIAALSAAGAPAQAVPQVSERGPDSRLIPAGKPLGRSARSDSAPRPARTARTAGHVSVTYQPLPQPAAAAQPAPAPAQQPAPAVQPAPAPPPQPQPVVVARLETPPPAAPPPAPAAPTAQPSLSIAAPAPAPVAAPQQRRVSLAEEFADFAASAPVKARRAPDAVDITAIKPAARAAPKPRPKAKPKPPADPSRVWVQVATGRDAKALAFDWRRIRKDGGRLLARRDAYTAKWGRTRRLVVGPYKSDDEAQDAVAALKKKGVNAFEFTSDEGEQVTPLE